MSDGLDARARAARGLARAGALLRAASARLGPAARDARPIAAPASPSTVTPRRLRSHLDLPADGSVVAGPLVTVGGWTVVDPIARIEVTVGGVTGSARQMAVPRADVAQQISSPHAAFCGFEHVVDLGAHRPGEAVTIAVTAVAPDGSTEAIGTTTVRLADAAPAFAGDPGDDGSGDADSGDAAWIAALRARTDAVAARHRPAGDGVRLLAVTHDLGLGGGQLYLHELLVRLVEAPDLRALVVSPTDGPLRAELEALGIEVVIAGTYPTDPAAHEQLLRSLAYVAADFGATAVVVNTAGALCGVDLGARLGLPVLWAIHESYAPEHYLLAAFGPGGAHPSAAGRLDEALRSASAVIFEAEATRRLWCTHGDPRRFLWVAYGIELASIDAFRVADDRASRRAALGWDDHDVVLLCVGTIEPRKAQVSLLRAFDRVVADRPDARLVFVGDRGDHYGKELREYAARLGVADRVHVEPVSPDLFEWYAAADAFVLASDVESLPRSVLEAMAFGLPVVVADVFGLHDLIDDGETGLLVPPRDLAALDAALRTLLALDPDERAQLGARGEAHVREAHDSRGYARVYRRLLDGFADDPTALPEVLLAD